jgi:hypothetical protein
MSVGASKLMTRYWRPLSQKLPSWKLIPRWRMASGHRVPLIFCTYHCRFKTDLNTTLLLLFFIFTSIFMFLHLFFSLSLSFDSPHSSYASWPHSPCLSFFISSSFFVFFFTSSLFTFLLPLILCDHTILLLVDILRCVMHLLFHLLFLSIHGSFHGAFCDNIT